MSDNRRETIREAGRSNAEQTLVSLSTLLVRTELAWVGRGLLKLLQYRWHDRPIRAEHAAAAATPVPKGPFKTTRNHHLGDLLLWVPRGVDSYLIDELTGGYGYSHTTVDTGEIDVPTGKPVMVEITVGQTVMHKFQDEYGRREFVRIPLRRAGVNVEKFIGCVESKMGEHYDALDALTLGKIEDPAKEVCSGLVADCLPDKELRKIAGAKRLGLLHGDSVSVHSSLVATHVRAFVSPNGFAEYYGAPKGRKVQRPNMTVQPRPISGSMRRMAGSATRRQGWKVAATILAIVLVAIVVRRRS